MSVKTAGIISAKNTGIISAKIEDLFIPPETFTDGFTQSEIGMMDECGFKWYLRYARRLEMAEGVVWWAIVGNAWHSTMEQMYSTQGKRWKVPTLTLPEDIAVTAEDEKKLEYWQCVLEVMADAYYNKYQKDFAILQIDPNWIEQTGDVTIEFEGIDIRLMGKLDLRAGLKGTKSFALWDHKTTALLNLTMTMGWDFKFQFMFYIWLARNLFKVNSFMVNAVKKPQIRQNKGETLEMFLARLAVDMVQRPENYFFREKLDMTTHSMQHFEEETLFPKLHRLKLLIDPKVPREVKAAIALNKNTGACHNWNRTCEFFQICHHGFDAEGFRYQIRKQKHSELEVE